jgi:hypothetical protein
MTTLLGQIGLKTEAHGFVENAIEFVTRSTVHHVVVAISETECISCEPFIGATIRPLNYDKFVWSRFDLTPEQAQNCANWARAREHRPYSFVNGFLIGLTMYGFTWPKFVWKHFSTDKSYQCAQFADAALTLGAGITVFDDGREFGQVFPGSLEALFKANGWWEEGVK